jgi:hypothetical protein
MTVKKVLWQNLLHVAKGKTAIAVDLLRELSGGKTRLSEMTEAEAQAAQIKFEQTYAGAEPKENDTNVQPV